jgi:hypothetical protein
MKHNGSCDKTCGHALDTFHVRYTAEIQRQLDRDPRVVEYCNIDTDWLWLEVTYAYRRPVAAIYRASAAHLGITELS